jgi:hypothetical protein
MIEMNKVYRVYCNGFVRTLSTLAATQSFIDWLRDNGCVGKEIVINVGFGNIQAASFDLSRERREILSAA